MYVVSWLVYHHDIEVSLCLYYCFLWFYCSQNFKLFGFPKRTWWRLFQKRVVHTNFDIYVFNFYGLFVSYLCIFCFLIVCFLLFYCLFLFLFLFFVVVVCFCFFMSGSCLDPFVRIVVAWWILVNPGESWSPLYPCASSIAFSSCRSFVPKSVQSSILGVHLTLPN